MNEREFELINIIGTKLGENQRDISRRMELSLGMTNMLVRRLISKGYIRISQLDKRKIKYILTPKGFSEKMRKSVNYTLKTINSIALVRNRLSTILKGLYGEGIRTFYVLGGEDLAGLIEMTMKESFLLEAKLLRINEIPTVVEEGVILDCREDGVAISTSIRTVNVVEELAKDEALLEQRNK